MKDGVCWPFVASGRVHKASLLWPASLALSLAGCHVDLSGLNQLFSSDPTYLSLPGTRIGNGKYSGVSVVGTNASGAHIAAFDASVTPNALTIFPFNGGKGCHSKASPFQYYPLDFGVRSTVPAIVGYLEHSGSDTLLHLMGMDCTEGVAPIKDKNFPIDATFDDPPGYLALDSSANLTFLEPWNKTTKIVAPSTHGPRIVQDKIWSIESSQLVVRDMQLNELARFGSNVREFDLAQNGGVRVMYVDGTCAAGASPCSGDLFSITDALGTPQKIDSDACNVIFPSHWGGLGVSYRSPCADRQLVTYGSVSIGGTPTKTIIDDSVLGSPDVDLMGATPYVFYEKSDDPKASTGTLYGGVLGTTLESITDGVTRDSSRGAPIIDKVADGWRMTVVSDSTQGGRLVTWAKGGSLQDVASGVAQISGNFAIVNFDGSVGDLVALNGATVSSPLAHRVPPQHILVGDPGTAVVADYDGNRGTLLVAIDGSNDFEEVSKGITISEMKNGNVAFLQSLPAIGYLHDFDAESGTGILGARLLETGDTFDIGIRASEWGEAGWPEPGIFYVAPEGDAAGIWFARLR
jgi:hypothetical protein